MKLTIGMITARRSPQFHWFIDSLLNQLSSSDEIEVLLVDLYQEIVEQQDYRSANGGFIHAERHPIKPTVWQGKYRLTSSDWWSISSSRNVIICLAKNPFVAMIDDRSVLSPNWLDCVRNAMDGNYAVNGSYEKVHNLVVESGVVKSYNEPGNGKDSRITKTIHQRMRPIPIYGGLWFGSNMALPLEWCLEVNGFDEWCDSIGLEDLVFGNMLAQNGLFTKLDPRMKIIEDRTPSEIGEMPNRTDKGVSPNDRSHALLDKIGGSKRATHPFNIRAMRDSVQGGTPFPPPWGPTHDFFDNEPLGEMYVR